MEVIRCGWFRDADTHQQILRREGTRHLCAWGTRCSGRGERGPKARGRKDPSSRPLTGTQACAHERTEPRLKKKIIHAFNSIVWNCLFQGTHSDIIKFFFNSSVNYWSGKNIYIWYHPLTHMPWLLPGLDILKLLLRHFMFLLWIFLAHSSLGFWCFPINLLKLFIDRGYLSLSSPEF